MFSKKFVKTFNQVWIILEWVGRGHSCWCHGKQTCLAFSVCFHW